MATLDQERVQEKLLSALSVAAGARGAALWAAGDDGELALAAVAGAARREGLPARLDARQGELAASLQGEPARTPVPPATELLLPLVAPGGEVVGAVLLQLGQRGLGAEERAAAARLARVGAVAVRNARRLRAAERLALRDPETGAYRLGVFLDYAGKELDRSRRYDRSFSLAVVAAEAPRRDGGGAERLAAARELAAAVSRAAREADAVARGADGEFCVLLPETDAFGALMFQRRAADEVGQVPALRARELTLGVATFPADGESLEQLLGACRDRQREQRASLLRGLRRTGAPVDGPQAFWPLVDLLLGGVAIPPGSPSARLPRDPDLLEAVQREAARELARDPRRRGALYVSLAPEAERVPAAAALPRLEAAARAGDVGSRMYVVGPRSAARGATELEHPLVTRAFADADERFATHAFVLFLSSGARYALLQGPGGVFHSSDAPLVEALVGKLQALHEVPPL